MMRACLAGALSLMFLGCESDSGGSDDSDACVSSQSAAFVSLGQGVGGAYEPFSDGEPVGLAVAPQGGFGVSVLIRTEGLAATEGSVADVQLSVELDGELAGDFLLEGAALLCQPEENAGLISGVVVGFDPSRFATNDDLVDLDGKEVVLDVTVTDSEGNSAQARQPVVISVSGG